MIAIALNHLRSALALKALTLALLLGPQDEKLDLAKAIRSFALKH